jgi:hypothetical protein
MSCWMLRKEMSAPYLTLRRLIFEVIGQGDDPQDGEGDGLKCDATPSLGEKEAAL